MKSCPVSSRVCVSPSLVSMLSFVDHCLTLSFFFSPLYCMFFGLGFWFLCCPFMCIYVLSSVLWWPLWLRLYLHVFVEGFIQYLRYLSSFSVLSFYDCPSCLFKSNDKCRDPMTTSTNHFSLRTKAEYQRLKTNAHDPMTKTNAAYRKKLCKSSVINIESWRV